MADARMRFHLGVTEQWVWDLSPVFHEDVLKASAHHQQKNAPFLCASETSPLWKWRKLSVHHTCIGIFVEASIVKPYIGHIKLHLVLWIDGNGVNLTLYPFCFNIPVCIHILSTNTSAVNKTDHFCGFLQALTKSQLPYPFCPNLCYYCGISNSNNSSFILHLTGTLSRHIIRHSCSTQLPMWIIFRGKKDKIDSIL